MSLFQRSSPIGVAAVSILLFLPVTTRAAGFLEKSFSCKVETKVEVTVVDDSQEGVEFLIDDCSCAQSAANFTYMLESACRSVASEAVQKGWNVAQAKAHLAKNPWKLEGAWESYKLSLQEQPSVTKTVYCATTDQLSRYMATCLQSAIGGAR